MRRERLFATLRVANAEIQPGNYFGLFDHVDNLARLVGFFIVKSDLRKGHEDRPGTEFLSRPRFAWEWGPRNTRKDAKGDERCGLGGACHVARPDIGRGRDALLRDPAWDVQKTCNANI